MNYEEIIKNQYEYLDKVNFIPYLYKYDYLDEIWDSVQHDYDGTKLTKNNFLQGHIFNQINHAELVEYLEHRYNLKFQEETRYYKCGT